MVNLELVYCRLITGNEKIETVKAVSSSYTALKNYCEITLKETVEEVEHWTNDHYVIRESEIKIVREYFHK
jgi:hypothetical protein